MSKPLKHLTSDFNDSLPNVFPLEHPHESSGHVFKPNSDMFLTLQFSL